MDVEQVIDEWDEVETDPESSDVSSESEDAALQELEDDSSDDDSDNSPSTSASPGSTPSARPNRSAAADDWSWREISESKLRIYDKYTTLSRNNTQVVTLLLNGHHSHNHLVHRRPCRPLHPQISSSRRSSQLKYGICWSTPGTESAQLLLAVAFFPHGTIPAEKR